jgi:hypothetical protein
MKAIRIPIMAIMAAAILVVPVGISAFHQQQAYAKKMTHEFEKAVIDAIGNPNDEPHPEFIPEMHKVWEDGVIRIFDGGPDTDQIRILLQSYGQVVATLLAFYFDSELQSHHLIKEVRQLTHDFEKAVLSAISDPEI